MTWMKENLHRHHTLAADLGFPRVLKQEVLGVVNDTVQYLKPPLKLFNRKEFKRRTRAKCCRSL